MSLPDIRPVRVVVAPVDWGIGHATRSLVVVEALRRRGADVVLASAGRPLAILREAFPDLPAVPLPAYAISYPTGWMSLDLALQAPFVLRVMRAEHAAVPEIVRAHRIEAVISDCRFGFFKSGVPSVLLTHQLDVGAHTAVLRSAGNGLLRRGIRHFNRCWIPDTPDRRLSGALSDAPEDIDCEFVGPLSHLGPVPAAEPGAGPSDLLVLLSGPEPQRTRLEKAFLRELRSMEGRVVLVRGTPTGVPLPDWTRRIEVIPFVTGGRLSALVASARVVACRPGYSTLMDLDRMGARTVLVPTPGQTEQVYLADRQARMGRAVVRSQHDLRLASAVAEASLLRMSDPTPDAGLLGDAVDRLLARVVASRRRA